MSAELVNIDNVNCSLLRFVLKRLPLENIFFNLQNLGLIEASSKFNFDDSTVVIVTGGSNGLGLEIVKLLLGKPLKKIIIADVVPACSSYLEDEKISYIKCDISEYKQVKNLYKKVISKYGTVTVLINNAGKTNIETLFTTTNRQLDKVMKINFLGAYFITTLFLPHILENNSGFIVNIASVLGETTPARLTAYGSSKGSLIAFHNTLTEYVEEIKNCNVKTILVCPGKIDTKMFESVNTPSKLLAPDVNPQALATEIVDMIEANRSGTIRKPYYTNLLPIYKTLNWPYFWLFKKLSGMNTVTAS